MSKLTTLNAANHAKWINLKFDAIVIRNNIHNLHISFLREATEHALNRRQADPALSNR